MPGSEWTSRELGFGEDVRRGCSVGRPLKTALPRDCSRGSVAYLKAVLITLRRAIGIHFIPLRDQQAAVGRHASQRFVVMEIEVTVHFDRVCHECSFEVVNAGATAAQR